MVIDHAGEVLCTQGDVFEDTVKLQKDGQSQKRRRKKKKGGGKKRKNDAIQKTQRLTASWEANHHINMQLAISGKEMF